MNIEPSFPASVCTHHITKYSKQYI